MKENCRKMPMHTTNGRFAGSGIVYDNYGEESGNPYYGRSGYPRFPHDGLDPKSLNGECIIVQKGRKKNEG